jgi:hypothetical protein
VAITGRRAPDARQSVTGPPVTDDPTIPGWLQLPRVGSGRSRSDRASLARRPGKPCGCGCGGHG